MPFLEGGRDRLDTEKKILEGYTPTECLTLRTGLWRLCSLLHMLLTEQVFMSSHPENRVTEFPLTVLTTRHSPPAPRLHFLTCKNRALGQQPPQGTLRNVLRKATRSEGNTGTRVGKPWAHTLAPTRHTPSRGAVSQPSRAHRAAVRAESTGERASKPAWGFAGAARCWLLSPQGRSKRHPCGLTKGAAHGCF